VKFRQNEKNKNKKENSLSKYSQFFEKIVNLGKENGKNSSHLSFDFCFLAFFFKLIFLLDKQVLRNLSPFNAKSLLR
jgi:hypothetical protein